MSPRAAGAGVALALGSSASTPAAAAPSASPIDRPPAPRQSSAIAALLRTFKVEFVWLIVFSAFANLLMLTPTIYMLQVFDRVMTSANLGTLAALTALMVVFTMVMSFSEWVRSRLLVRAGSRFDDALNRRVFTAAFAAQLGRTRGNPVQPLADLNVLRQFLSGNGVFAVVDTPWAVIFVVALFLMHPWLGALALVFCVVQLALGFAAHRYVRRSQQATQDLALDSAQYLQAKFRNAETVEAMGMQGNLRNQWLSLNERQSRQQSRATEASHRIQAVMKWLQYTQQALMLSLGAWLVIDGQIGVGAMVASNALMGNALRPVGLIVQIWGQFAEARAAYDRLDGLMVAHPEASAHPPAGSVEGQVTLRGLTAGAPGRAEPILKGLDAEFQAGEVVAIVGPSGAGKSTLARCLLGIWPGAGGEVLIDGHAITAWPREALGPHVGYLPQDVELFDGTIADNVSRFSEVASDVVIDAAKAAGIHDMVLRLPKGYDTPIGEAGSMLSGGQRQRLGLARALLGQPALVVLDEPNANLDDAGETALLHAVRALKARRSTVFMIVHQPHLLAAADRVLVLDDGRITRLAKVVLAPAPAAPSPQASTAGAPATAAAPSSATTPTP